MDLYLPDEFYDLIAHHLPPEQPVGLHGGRPRIGHRVVVRVIWFVLASGTRWEDVPPELGCSGRTAHRRLRAWEEAGIWDRLHADLLRLSMTNVTQVSVAVEPVGEPTGVKQQGGIFDLHLREVEIECLPGDIPERIQVDVSGLHIGDHVTVADLVYDREKITMLTDEHHVVAGVLAPRMIEEEAPKPAVEGEAAAAATPEPEVIKKGKAEEE